MPKEVTPNIIEPEHIEDTRTDGVYIGDPMPPLKPYVPVMGPPMPGQSAQEMADSLKDTAEKISPGTTELIRQPSGRRVRVSVVSARRKRPTAQEVADRHAAKLYKWTAGAFVTGAVLGVILKGLSAWR